MARTLEERINGPEPEAWIPENADEYIIGELEEISEREGDYGPYRVITLLTADGPKNVAGFGTVLAGKFASLSNADIGCDVAVKFLGEQPSKKPGGKAYKNWNMTVDRKPVPVTAGSFADTDDDI